MIQYRDTLILDFISTFELCTKEHIQKLFFKDTTRNVSARRLKKLTDDYELLNRIKIGGNRFVYYAEKKPSKRLLDHDLLLTDLVVEMILNGFEILEFKKSFIVGNVISDAYILYKNKNGDIKNMVVEVQLSNSIKSCVLKYENYKEKLIDNKIKIGTVPRLLVITDLSNKVTVEGMKVKYLNTKFEKLEEIL